MALGALALPAGLLRAAPKQPPDLQRVCQRLLAMDNWRTTNLLGYSGMRRYSLGRGSSGECAEMVVKVEYTYPGHKSFQVVSEKNCGPMHEQAFRRVMNAELQAARDDIRDSTRILPRNYDFEMLGAEELEGRPSYLIRIRPKRKQRFLVDGKIWVDAQDAAVARIDGEVAASSFWVRSSHMIQRYRKIGPYWLVASNHNDAKVRWLGEVRLGIEYFDYQLHSA